jgi:hypothetical protein
MPFSKSVAAFFEPGAPPPPLPLLTSQTDLFYDTPCPSTIVAHEELVMKRQGKPLLATREGVQRMRKTIPHHHQASPLIPKPLEVDVDGHEDVQEDDDLSSGVSDAQSKASDDSDEGKIPKPIGEPGRPGHGGYSLESAISWDALAFKKLKVVIPFIVVIHSR